MEFEYIAIDKEGKQIKSAINAASAVMAADSIAKSGRKLVRIVPARTGKGVAGGAIFANRDKVTTKELVVFTRLMGSILSAGILLSEALETIAVDQENPYFANVLKETLFYIRGGASFSTPAQAVRPGMPSAPR